MSKTEREIEEEKEIELYKRQFEDSKTEEYIRPITYLQQDIFTEAICYEAVMRCVNRKMREVRFYKPYKKDKTLEEIKEQLDLEMDSGYSWVYRWIDDTRTSLVIRQIGRFLRIKSKDTEQIIDFMVETLEHSAAYIPLLNRFVFEPTKFLPDRKLKTKYYFWEIVEPPHVEEEQDEDEENEE